MKIIADKKINYPLGFIVWTVAFIIFYFLLSYVDLNGKFWTLLAFAGGGFIGIGHKRTVALQTTSMLTFMGEAVKDEHGQIVFLTPGTYFTFGLFDISGKETHTTEESDVIVETFDCQDRFGKQLKAKANGGFDIIDSNVYQHLNEKVVMTDLSSLIQQTIIRLCGSKDYLNGLLGEDIGLMIRNDHPFQCETGRYGVSFHKMHATVVSANLSQDDFNAQFDRLVEREKAAYGHGYKFSHKELQDIKDDVKVRLNRSKQIITNAPTVGRFDVDGH